MFSTIHAFIIVLSIGLCQLLVTMQQPDESGRTIMILVKGTVLGIVLGLIVVFGYEGFKDVFAEIINES